MHRAEAGNSSVSKYPPVRMIPGRRSNGMSANHALNDPGPAGVSPGVCQRIVDFGLLAILIVAPLCMGGRHPLGELVFVSLVALVTSAWLVGKSTEARGRYSVSGAEGLLLAGLLLVSLQLVGLPQTVLSVVSPGLHEALPLWSSNSGSISGSEWNTVSVAPHETLAGLSLFAAYCMFFTVLVQRVRSIDDAEHFLKWIAISAVSMTIIGLAQFFFGNGRFLWVYEHPFRTSDSTVMGTFQNRNHFAHFLALGVGPLIWWIWKSCQRDSNSRRHSQHDWGSSSSLTAASQIKLPLLFVALGLTGVATTLSLSRAGLVVFAGAALVCSACLAMKSLLGRKAVIAILCVTVLTGTGAVLYGTQSLEARFEKLAAASSFEDASSGRRQIWEAVLQGVPDFIGMGSGVGTHRFVYPRYISGDHRVEYSHAENGYLQILLETGIAGASLFILGLVLCGVWCFKAFRNSPTDRHAACLAAVLSGLAASLCHSIVDFVWYIPACMSLTIALIAVVWRLSRAASDGHGRLTDNGKSFPIPRPIWCGGALAAFGIFYVMLGVHLSPALASAHWDSFHRLSLAETQSEFEQNTESLDKQIEYLENVVSIDSANPRAHLSLASLLRLKFDDAQSRSSIPMPLAQIRDAANTSPFPSREALDEWLTRIMDDRRQFLNRSLDHSRQAISLCPFQGEAYIFMAELNFLRETSRDHELALIDQALQTRPEAPPVLVTAGREALLAGDNETGLKHFRKVFTLGGTYQHLVIQALGRQDAEFFFETFPFDTSSMLSLRNHYAGIGNIEQGRIVGTRLAKNLVEQAAAASGPDAADAWNRARDAFVFLKDDENALQAARNAVASDPYEYSHRKALVTLLVAQKKFDEAVPLLEWCLKQYPENRELKQALLLARSQVQQASFTTDSLKRQ